MRDQREALAMHDSVAPGDADTRAEFQGRLEQFERAAAGADAAELPEPVP